MKIDATAHAPQKKPKAATVAAFTLIEVIMGAAVIGVVMITIFSIVTVGLFITGTSRENLRATQIMLDKMEGLRLYTPEQLTNGHVLVPSFTNWYVETNNIGMTNAQGYGVQYTGVITISPVIFSTSYSSNMSMVTVSVGWVSLGQGAISHTRSMSTFYSTQGLENYVYISP